MNKNLPLCSFFYVSSFPLFVSSGSWFLSWVIMEMNTLTFLTYLFKKNHRMEISLIYLMMQSISSLLLLVSLSMLETTNILTTPSSFLLMMSVFLKLASPPFHSWFIFISFYSSDLCFFLLLTMQKIIPFFMLIFTFSTLSEMFLMIMLSCAVMSSLLNLTQMSLKMILIFSGMTHMAWMLMSTQVLSLWTFYFLIYTSLTLLISPYFSSYMKNILMKKNQNLFFFLLFLSLMGIPPLTGFFPKLMILQLMTQNTLFAMMTIMLMSVVVDMFIYSRVSFMNMMNINPSWLWFKKNKKNTILLLSMNIIITCMIMI